MTGNTERERSTAAAQDPARNRVGPVIHARFSASAAGGFARGAPQAKLAARMQGGYRPAPMENFAEPARALVAQMTQAAAAAPDRAVAFQGAPGANSHIAAVEAFPDGLPLPCFDFADAIDAVRDGRADCAIIPIENSLHGRVADIHFLLPESGLVITG
eukprot:gene46760-60280_t